ncbi:MAG: MBL fold metallo-hydrolase [Myxococcales bacterium]|nr:MBL fold metallo-hydrolase [Myxococcales bacterium]
MPRFQNLEPPHLPPPIGRVLRWAVVDKLAGRRRAAPSRCEMPVVEHDAALLRSDAPSCTWVGHATWVVRLAGCTILTDPVWSKSLGPTIRRNVAPGVPEADLSPDIVLVSHNHRDHLDAPTIRRLGAEPTYVVPSRLGDFFRRRGYREVLELEWWQTVELKGVAITLVPSQHWSQRGPADKNETLWGGFVMEAQGHRVYFAGDTAYFGGFAQIGAAFPDIDAALLPIGAYDPEWFMRHQHMNPEDAVRAFLDLGARRLCAMHWGTFKLTDEPLDEPPQLLERARQELGIERTRIWVAAIGESLRL